MSGGNSPSIVQLVATGLFAVAVLHTFSTRYFEHLAHAQPNHAGLWHLLGEVETVFGFWAMVLLLFLAIYATPHEALGYLESRKFTEPAFIFVIMVIAASRPILDFSGALLLWLARLLPLAPPTAYYLTVLFVGPLLGSFITEPAAMTLTAMLLRERYFSPQAPNSFKYGTLGVLFVNISIGGTLTPFAAPPVLMVADRWGWDFAFMLHTFGWKAALAVLTNAAVAAIIFRSYLKQLPTISPASARIEIPWPIICVHLVFLIGVVIASHHTSVFAGLFLFFLGFAEAYRRYQNRLILRDGPLVGLFLAGLVVLGGMQEWWLGPLLSNLNTTALYYGATALTSITDNAALTYLGSLVDGLSPEAKYSLVAGAVSGGGLTVIANAPNPAGFAILKGTFDDGAISPLWLALAATPPTLTAIAAFQLLPG
ncbi:MAG: putative Na+/H+ antiporter [Rhizobiales bacterium]|nr:putative Na+/H+ antiporter [Hyphomicrobiales bacterium]